jgi:hypothetical protein
VNQCEAATGTVERGRATTAQTLQNIGLAKRHEDVTNLTFRDIDGVLG